MLFLSFSENMDMFKSLNLIIIRSIVLCTLISCQKNTQNLSDSKPLVLTQNPNIEVGALSGDQIILQLDAFPREIVYENQTYQVQLLTTTGNLKNADLFLLIEASAVAGAKTLRAAVPLSSPKVDKNSVCEPHMNLCIVELPLDKWEFPMDENDCYFSCGAVDPNAGSGYKSHSISTELFFKEAFEQLTYRRS